MTPIKYLIKDVIGFIFMMCIVSVFLYFFKVTDSNSYIIGLLVGFGMPTFMKAWTKYIVIK